jgi:hypothetical protein
LRPEGAVIVRYVNVEQTCLFGCAFPDRAAEIAVLYGLTPHSQFFAATVAAGVSAFTTLQRERRDVSPARTRETNVGIPVELGGSFRPFSLVAFNLSGVADLNLGHAFWAAFLGLQLGLY